MAFFLYRMKVRHPLSNVPYIPNIKLMLKYKYNYLLRGLQTMTFLKSAIINKILLCFSIYLVVLVFLLQTSVTYAASQNELIIGNNSQSDAADYVCDGTADDTEIQQAIDMVSSQGGGIIKLLAGTYYPRKEIGLKDNVTLSMDEGACIKMPEQTIVELSADYTAGSAAISVVDSAYFVVGEHIGLVLGAAPGYKPGDLTQITAINGNQLTISPAISSTYLVSNNAVCISHYSILGIHGVNNTAVIGGELDGGKESGASKIYIHNADSTFNCISSSDNCDNTLIKDVYIHGALFRGIHAWGKHSRLRIENCILSGSGGGGICLDTLFKGSDTTLINVTSDNNDGDGLTGTGVENVTILGGSFSNNGLNGISLGNALTTPGFGNYKLYIGKANISNNGLNGIVMNGASRVLISGNTIDGNGQNGISVLSRSKENFIYNNIIRNFQKGIFEQDSDITKIADNTFVNCIQNTILSGKHSMVEEDYFLPSYSQKTILGQSASISDDIELNAVKLDFQGRTITNKLGDYGDIELHSAQYASTGLYGPVNIWAGGLVKDIDGYKVLDCFFSDFDWAGNNPRCNYIRVPSISGHKYLITMKIKKQFEIRLIDPDTGNTINTSVTNQPGWSNFSMTAASTGKDLVFLLYAGYVTFDAGYCKDIQVFDLTKSGDDSLSISDLENIYSNFLINGTQDTAPFTLTVTTPDSRQEDLLNGKGDIDANLAEYSLGGVFDIFYIWANGLVKNVDGFSVIDGFFSDYEWICPIESTYNPRSSFFKVPSIAGHNYVVTAKAKGDFSIVQINPETGATIGTTSYNQPFWGNITYKAAGTGKDLVFLLRSVYITNDAGYGRDFKVFDLNYRGDENLDAAAVQAKYSVDANLAVGNIVNTINVPVTLRSAGDERDSLSYNGVLTRNVESTQLSGAEFDSLIDLNNVSVVKSVSISDCLPGVVNQTGGIDNTIDIHGWDEIPDSDVDNISEIGKFYTSSDGIIGLIVQKGAYADIDAARTDLGTLSVSYAVYNSTTQDIGIVCAAVSANGSNLSFSGYTGTLPKVGYTYGNNEYSNYLINKDIETIVPEIEKPDYLISPSEPAYINVTGTDSIEVPSASASSSFSAVVKEQSTNLFSSGVVVWDVIGNTKGVSIDNSGSLTVTSDSLGGDVAAAASSSIDGNILNARLVSLQTVVTDINLTGLQSIDISDGVSHTAQYSSTVLDQLGRTMYGEGVSYQILNSEYNPADRLSINSSGLMTVQNDAYNGTYYVKAISASTPAVSKLLQITITGGTNPPPVTPPEQPSSPSHSGSSIQPTINTNLDSNLLILIEKVLKAYLPDGQIKMVGRYIGEDRKWFSVSNDNNYNCVISINIENNAAAPARFRVAGKSGLSILGFKNEVYALAKVNRTFSDIENHWAKDYIEAMASRLVVNGVSKELFKPNRKMTRAEFVTLLVNAYGGIRKVSQDNRFSDVKSDEWYYDEVLYAADLGIINGYRGRFFPNDTITREEMAAAIMRMYNLLTTGNDFTKDTADESFRFSDNDGISDWSKQAVYAAKQKGIILGRPDNSFCPLDDATAAEGVVMVYRLIVNF